MKFYCQVITENDTTKLIPLNEEGFQKRLLELVGYEVEVTLEKRKKTEEG